MKKIKDLIKDLVDHAFLDKYIRSNKPKIGELIQRLNSKDRELIQTLKPEDMADIRFPNPDDLLDKTEEQQKKRISKIRVNNYPTN